MGAIYIRIYRGAFTNSCRICARVWTIRATQDCTRTRVFGPPKPVCPNQAKRLRCTEQNRSGPSQAVFTHASLSLIPPHTHTHTHTHTHFSVNDYELFSVPGKRPMLSPSSSARPSTGRRLARLLPPATPSHSPLRQWPTPPPPTPPTAIRKRPVITSIQGAMAYLHRQSTCGCPAGGVLEERGFPVQTLMELADCV